MSDRYREGAALDKAGLFQLVTDEAFRDGVLEPAEEKILQVIARFLKLPAEEAREIARLSKRKFQAGELGEAGRLDPQRLYARALDLVASDGEVDALEEQMLQGLRQLLGIQDATHERLLADRLGASGRAEAAAIPAALDLPSESRNAFHLRVGQGRTEAQVEEDRCWAHLARGARDGVMKVWGTFLDSLPPNPVEPLVAALETLEKGVRHPRCTPEDRAVVLRLAQVSRVLLRTQWGVGATLWFGDERYPAVMRTLAGVLAELEHHPRHESVDEALDLALHDLWRDLIHVTRRRQREALVALCPALVAACRAGAHLEASRLGEAILPAVLESLGVSDEGCLATVLELQEVLGRLPPAGDDRRAASSPLARRIPLDLERLRRETAFMRPAARAAARLDRAPFEEVFESFRASVEKDGMPWSAFRSSFFAATAVPEPEGLDRPMVVILASGDGQDAREQLKTLRVELRARRDDSGILVFAVDLGPDASTRPLLPPLDPGTAKAFEVALDAAEGRYLVLLVDRELRPLRVHEQQGDLDASGTFDRAFQCLGEQDAEAATLFGELLARRPWLAMAHVHLGLIAKRAGDRDGAREHFEAALAVQPDDPVALTRLGVLAKQASDGERAVELLSRSLAIDPTQPDASGTLASIHVGAMMSDPEAVGRWISVTTELHAILGGGPDLRSLREGLVAAGLPEGIFRHLGQVAADPVCYG